MAVLSSLYLLLVVFAVLATSSILRVRRCSSGVSGDKQWGGYHYPRPEHRHFNHSHWQGHQQLNTVHHADTVHNPHYIGQTNDLKPSQTMDRLGQWPADGRPLPTHTHNLDFVRDPKKNKGMGFSLEERQRLRLHGLLPPVFKTQDEQLSQVKANFDRYTDPLNKYIYLMGLQERNERLFYRFLNDYIEEAMPIVYTPTVGLACQNYGLVYRQPRGLFITIHDKGHIYDILTNWPEADVRAIVVTDGERILGLGDLGAQGMGIPVGKLALYTALAGIKPHQCLPITIDVGTNTQKLLDDPLYIGLRERRVRGKEYDELLDEFMQAVVKRFGQSVLIQFEDFGNANAFRLLEKYRNKYLTFNDDIQGTASVAVAGLLASLRATKSRLSDHIILFQGAGEANLGIAELCVMAMEEEGLTRDQAKTKIWMVDSKGLIVFDRPEGGLTEHKIKFAHNHAPIKELVDVVKAVKPTVLIGASAIPGAFTPEILMQMAKNSPRPIIFALSNPTHKAEATAEDVYTHTNGTALFASGSPFPPFTFQGKTHYPGQGNNAYIFPGVALGAIAAGVRHISDDFFLESAKTLASLVSEDDLDRGMLYPHLSQIRNCSDRIAVDTMKFAYYKGLASVYPEPEDKERFIKSQQYDFSYSPALPVPYPWPTKL